MGTFKKSCSYIWDTNVPPKRWIKITSSFNKTSTQLMNNKQAVIIVGGLY